MELRITLLFWRAVNSSFTKRSVSDVSFEEGQFYQTACGSCGFRFSSSFPVRSGVVPLNTFYGTTFFSTLDLNLKMSENAGKLCLYFHAHILVNQSYRLRLFQCAILEMHLIWACIVLF